MVLHESESLQVYNFEGKKITMKTREDVKQFQEWGKDNKVIVKMMSNKSKFQPYMYNTGYYSAPSWNWAYQFGIVKIGGKYYELMTQFGGVRGGREIFMHKYNAKLERVN